MNEEARAEWRERKTHWRAEQMVFLDESAVNERTLDRKYGWAPVGLEASVTSPFHRSRFRNLSRLI